MFVWEAVRSGRTPGSWDEHVFNLLHLKTLQPLKLCLSYVSLERKTLCAVFQNQTGIPGSKDKQLRWTRRMQTFNLPSL